MKSESIGKLAEALCRAQGEMLNATKDKENPFYKSTYADLADIWNACRIPLSKNGLAITQTLNTDQGKLTLITMLMHLSGEWISSEVPIQPVKQDPQGVGSAITYMRRFSLAAIVGVAPADGSDDDGNAASDKNKPSHAEFKSSQNVKSVYTTQHEMNRATQPNSFPNTPQRSVK